MPKNRIYKKGEHIGPYEVIALIAPGAMGCVYEARPLPGLRSDLLDRGIERVMIKVARVEVIPRDPYLYRQLRERLDREFQTLLALAPKQHPNVVQVYDYGWENGVPYYAMEVVDGPTLADALAQRPHLGQVLHVIGELCGAVAFLHNAGICHRDLKPDNVMLRRDGGSPVLIDFGICLPPTGHKLTGPHELLGSPEYLSPGYAEHLLNPKETRAYPSLPADDVWSLGITLYEIVTGAVPWQTPAGHRDALLREIKRGRVVHPCKVNPQVPAALGELVMRMLEPSRRARLQNANEVLEQLGLAAERSNTLGRVPVPRERHPRAGDSGPGNERGQLSIGLFAVAGLGLAIFTAGSFYGGAAVLKRVHASQPGQQPPSDLAQASAHAGPTQPEPAVQPGQAEVPGAGAPPAGVDPAEGNAPPANPAVDQPAAGASQRADQESSEKWVPKAPPSDQKRGSCDPRQGETAINGGCWIYIAAVKPPCGVLFRYGDSCYRPVNADPQVPRSSKAQ